MATPRKHWFNVTEALCRAGLDNDALACAVRLMGEMNAQRARDELTPEQACHIRLRPGALADVTGKRQPHAARALVARAAHALRTLAEYEVSADTTRPEFVEIKWANLAELQDWRTRPPGNESPKVARELPTPTPTPTPTPEEEEKSPPAAPAPTRTRKAAKTSAAGPLVPEQIEALRSWCLQHEDPGIRERAPHVERLAECCLDHHRSKGNRQADWVATVRTWIRNDLEFARRDGKEPSLEERRKTERLLRQIRAIGADQPEPEIPPEALAEMNRRMITIGGAR